MANLRIGQLSTPFFSVPPKNYGAIEYIAYLLSEELVRRGHDVTLLTTGDSQTKAKVLSVFSKEMRPKDIEALYSELAFKLPWMQSIPSLLHIEKMLSQAGQFDIIHNHFHYLPLFFSEYIKTPMVHTYHGNFLFADKSPIENMVLEKYKDSAWVAISESQKRNCKIPLNFVDVIYHGIDIENYPVGGGEDGYLVWLGRLNKQKGVVEAVKVAKAVGKKLILAGIINKRDEEFFKTEVEPLLDEERTFIGPVSQAQKAEVLGKASALLYPVNWDEPFGLVMIESMATGTPVIGFNKGAVPEVVVDGETGFVVETEDEMIEAVGKISQIDRSNPRKRVEEKFTVEKMVDRHEEVYQKIIQNS